MAVKAIVFDLYGVLGLNSWQAFKSLHFADRPQDWEQLRLLGQRVDAGEASQQDLVVAIAESTGESVTTVQHQLDHTTPNVPLLEYIARLKPTYKLGLLSNASRDVFPSIFSADQLALFDAAISSYHVGFVKPDPRMYLGICAELGVSPQECIMVDDTQRHLDAANTLGMSTVLYTSVEQTIADIGRVLAND